MLARLTVQNYALIDALEVSFEPGLNLLTGETGAGKSLLVDAIGLILGRRADSTVLFDPERKCVVEAEFARVPQSVLAEVSDEFRQAEAELGDGSSVIVRREIAPGGKSRAFVNDTPVTLVLLKTLAERMVDLHSQHEGQRLLEPRVQLDALDRYAGSSEAARRFGQRWAELKALHAELDALRAGEAEARRLLDYAQFQLNELTQAQLEPGEDERLEAQLKRLEHAEQIVATLSRQVALLADDDPSLAATLRTSTKELERLSALDSRVAEPAQRLEELRLQLDAVADSLRALADDTELDPRHQQQLSERLDTYNRLKVKFAVRTADELIALREQFAEQVQRVGAAPTRIAELEAQLHRLRESLAAEGLALERARLEAVGRLSPVLAGLLADVGLPNATVEIRVTRLPAGEAPLVVDGVPSGADARGLNRVAFWVSTNRGVAPGPLQQVASGGEVARVMLALKAALAEHLGLSALIFDEIDTGISGEVAMKVGRVLQRLSARRQLLVITHLPQIASRPGSHFFLYKENRQGRPVTRLRRLETPAREAEIAKMLSGDPPPAPALDNARELLATP